MAHIIHQKITIINIQRNDTDSLNENLQWFGETLGLFNPRDKDSSCFRVFIELLKAAKVNMPMSSDDVASRLNLSRGTVIHHINKLMEAGLVITHGNRYMLRVNRLETLVDELQKDAERTFGRLRNVARHVDESLGM
jgi:predicted transcriptional regulator